MQEFHVAWGKLYVRIALACSRKQGTFTAPFTPLLFLHSNLLRGGKQGGGVCVYWGMLPTHRKMPSISAVEKEPHAPMHDGSAEKNLGFLMKIK